jgi:flagellar hook-associated protein 1 FlgK
MPNLSAGINIALSAILTQSQAIEITEHNVANANTPGYRRQAPLISSTMAAPVFADEHGLLAGQRGMGVTIDKIQRFNLEYFDGRYRAVSGETKNYEARRDVLTQLETVLSETSNDGMLPQLDQFWAGWQSLASDPTNTALRQQILDEGASLAESFQKRSQAMLQLRMDQNQAIAGQAAQINEIAKNIADLNGEISHVLSVGEQPNDLMDKRDILLDQLAEISGAVSSVQANGEMLVSIGGHALVTGHSVFTLSAAPDANGLNQITWSDGQTLTPPTGSLKGLFIARDTTIVNQMNGLDALANAVITQVNAIHLTGHGLNANPPQVFFTGTTAATIAVSGTLTAADVATASAAGQPGNGDIAEKLAALKSAQVMNGGTATMGDYYNSQITALGMEVQQATQKAYSNNLVGKALSDQRESVAGVNLDEEAANMVKFQRAYQAAARIMTVYDDMLNTVINNMGLVGR